MRQPKVSMTSKEWLWFTLPFMPHIPALSHFFGWSKRHFFGAFFFVSVQRTKAGPIEAGTVTKPLPAQSYSLPVSAPALPGLCVHHFNPSPFNCMFLWSHSSAKPALHHSKRSICAGPSTREEEGMTEQRWGRNDRAEVWREKLPLQQQHSPRSAQASPARLSPAKLSSGAWAPQEGSVSAQPMRCHLPPCAWGSSRGNKQPPGQQRTISNIPTVTPEPGKQPPHPQAAKQESQKCAGNISPFLERRQSTTRELWVVMGLTNPPV